MGGAHWKRSPVAAPDKKKLLFNSVIDRPLQNGLASPGPRATNTSHPICRGTQQRGPLDAATCLILFASQGDKLLGKERSSRNAHLQITASRITGPATA
ncbi:hypothetical protein A9K55_008496 [Cordyceps militaris]|uniref:Uncharacterized protein n=1 Tax=Cordyceps militaris TaxID=73501 RepID=A0A2H4SKK2_CORMI|nr:hypothetical protein A9K55_008496 [Cordyceps militaris]